MKIKISFICFFFLWITSFKTTASTVDSVGIKAVDGVKYIIHKVEPRETLYSLGKRYHVSVAEIQEVNPAEKDGYKIDQIGRELLIPYNPKFFKSSQKAEEKVGNKEMLHKVEAGQTIYAIALMYEVSQENIMDWNNLESTNLNIGQKLWVSDPNGFQTPKKQEQEVENLESKQTGGITHVVDLGETIYSISKEYQVTQSEIIELNSLKDNNIAVGQKLIIKVSTEKEQVKTQKELLPETEAPSRPKTHKAKKGEDYSTIAQMYGVKEAKLRKWNKFKEPFVGGEVIKTDEPENAKKEKVATADANMADDSRLHTVKSGETLYSLSEEYKVEVEDLRKWNSLDSYQLSRGQKLYIQNPDALMADVEIEQPEESKTEDTKPSDELSENPQKQDTRAYFTVEEDDMPKIDKVKESGVAEVIEGSEGTEKYLALHRTAKIGTIMQVRNDLNDQIVFVRVLGKLPNTGVDEKVVIKISKKAFEKLGGVDYKFPVEISYLPLKD